MHQCVKMCFTKYLSQNSVSCCIFLGCVLLLSDLPRLKKSVVCLFLREAVKATNLSTIILRVFSFWTRRSIVSFFLRCFRRSVKCQDPRTLAGRGSEGRCSALGAPLEGLTFNSTTVLLVKASIALSVNPTQVTATLSRKSQTGAKHHIQCGEEHLLAGRHLQQASLILWLLDPVHGFWIGERRA